MVTRSAAGLCALVVWGWPFGAAWWPGLGRVSEAWHGRA